MICFMGFWWTYASVKVVHIISDVPRGGIKLNKLY